MGDARGVELLLGARAQVECTTLVGPKTPMPLTPVAAAAMQGRDDLVRLLMQNGGTANFLDWDIFRHFDVRGALEPHMLLALGVVPDALDHSTD
mmetsp:Transcript_94535/g.138034  ORF Transcript_94535/g.138034 Transcript_94535/m.138034 type:complete len:94 (-) Transcript_94535:478-759(-)